MSVIRYTLNNIYNIYAGFEKSDEHLIELHTLRIRTLPIALKCHQMLLNHVRSPSQKHTHNTLNFD